MKIIAPVLRIFSYLFHLILALFLLGASLVTVISGHHNLSFGMLPWTGESLTYWLLGLGVFGVLSVLLAVTGKLRVLLILWSVSVLVMMIRGFFLSSYTFSGPDQAKFAMWLITGALVAFIGSILSPEGKRKPSYR